MQAHSKLMELNASKLIASLWNYIQALSKLRKLHAFVASLDN